MLLILARSLTELSAALRFLPTGVNLSAEGGAFGDLSFQHISIQSVPVPWYPACCRAAWPLRARRVASEMTARQFRVNVEGARTVCGAEAVVCLADLTLRMSLVARSSFWLSSQRGLLVVHEARGNISLMPSSWSPRGQRFLDEQVRRVEFGAEGARLAWSTRPGSGGVLVKGGLSAASAAVCLPQEAGVLLELRGVSAVADGSGGSESIQVEAENVEMKVYSQCRGSRSVRASLPPEEESCIVFVGKTAKLSKWAGSPWSAAVANADLTACLEDHLRETLECIARYARLTPEGLPTTSPAPTDGAGLARGHLAELCRWNVEVGALVFRLTLRGCLHTFEVSRGGAVSLSVLEGGLVEATARAAELVWTAADGTRVADVRDTEIGYSWDGDWTLCAENCFMDLGKDIYRDILALQDYVSENIPTERSEVPAAPNGRVVLRGTAVIRVHFSVDSDNRVIGDTAGVDVLLGASIFEIWSAAHQYRCQLQAQQVLAFQKNQVGCMTPLVLAPASETESTAPSARDHTFTYEVREDSSYRSKLVLDGATVMWPYLHDLSVWDNLLNVFTLHDSEVDVSYAVETVLKGPSILLSHSAGECCIAATCTSKGASTNEKLQSLTDEFQQAVRSFKGMQLHLVQLFSKVSGQGLDSRSKYVMSSLSFTTGCQAGLLMDPCNLILERTTGSTGRTPESQCYFMRDLVKFDRAGLSLSAAAVQFLKEFSESYWAADALVVESTRQWLMAQGLQSTEYSFGILAEALSFSFRDQSTSRLEVEARKVVGDYLASGSAATDLKFEMALRARSWNSLTESLVPLVEPWQVSLYRKTSDAHHTCVLQSEARLNILLSPALAVPLLDLWKGYTAPDTGAESDLEGALLPQVATASALSYPKLFGSPSDDFVLENSTGMKLWLWQRNATPAMRAVVPGESLVVATQGVGALADWCVKPDGPWASVQGEQLLHSAYEAPSLVKSAPALVVEFVSSTDARAIPVVVRQSVDQQGEDRPRLKLSLTTHLCIHNHTSTQLRLKFHDHRGVIREDVEPGGTTYAPGPAFLGAGMEVGLPGYRWSEDRFPLQRIYSTLGSSSFACSPKLPGSSSQPSIFLGLTTAHSGHANSSSRDGASQPLYSVFVMPSIVLHNSLPPPFSAQVAVWNKGKGPPPRQAQRADALSPRTWWNAQRADFRESIRTLGSGSCTDLYISSTGQIWMMLTVCRTDTEGTLEWSTVQPVCIAGRSRKAPRRTRNLVLHPQVGQEGQPPLRIAVRVEFSNPSYASMKVKIFAPFAIFNYSQRALELRTDRRGPYERVEALEACSGENSVILCHSGRGRIRIPGSRASSPVHFNAVGLDSTVNLVCDGGAAAGSGAGEVIVTLSVSRQMGKGVLEDTCLVSAAPCAVLVNESPYRLSYRQTALSGGILRTLSPNGLAAPLSSMGVSCGSKTKPLSWRSSRRKTQGMSLILRLTEGEGAGASAPPRDGEADQIGGWSAPVAIGSTGSQIVCVPRVCSSSGSDLFEDSFLFLRAETTFCGPCLTVRLTEERKEKLPYRIENYSRSACVMFHQAGSSGMMFRLPPGQSTRFAFPSPSRPQKVSCAVGLVLAADEPDFHCASAKSKVYDLSVVGARQPLKLKAKAIKSQGSLLPYAQSTHRLRQSSARVLRRVASLARGFGFPFCRTGGPARGWNDDLKHSSDQHASWQVVQVQVSGGPVRCLSFSDEVFDARVADGSAASLLSLEQQLRDVRENIGDLDRFISTLPLAERRTMWSGLKTPNPAAEDAPSPHKRPPRGSAHPRLKGILKKVTGGADCGSAEPPMRAPRCPWPSLEDETGRESILVVNVVGAQGLPPLPGSVYCRVHHSSARADLAATVKFGRARRGGGTAWKESRVELLCPPAGEIFVDVYLSRVGGLKEQRLGSASIPISKIGRSIAERETQAFPLRMASPSKPSNGGTVLLSLDWNCDRTETLLSELKEKQEELSLKEDMLLLLDSQSHAAQPRPVDGSAVASMSGAPRSSHRVTARRANRILRSLEVQLIESSACSQTPGRRSRGRTRGSAACTRTYIRVQVNGAGGAQHETKVHRGVSEHTWNEGFAFEGLSGSSVLLLQMFCRNAFRRDTLVAQGHATLSDLVFDLVEPQLLWAPLRTMTGEHYCTLKLQLRCPTWEVPEAQSELRVALHSVGIALSDDSWGGGGGSRPHEAGDLYGSEEIAHVFAGRVELGLLRSSKEEHMQLSVSEFQCDNQMGSASFPVVLCRTPVRRRQRGGAGSGCPPVAEGSYVRSLVGPVFHLRQASLQLQELDLIVEEAFLDRCANVYHRSLHHIRGMECCADVWSRLMGGLAGHSGLQGAVREKKICIGALSIRPARVNVTVIPSPTSFCSMPLQQSALWPRWLAKSSAAGTGVLLGTRQHCPVLFSPVRRFREETGLPVLGLQRVRIKLNGVSFSDVVSGRQEIVSQIVGHYRNQALLEVYKVIGSLDAIGNPAGAVAGLGQGILCVLQEPAKGFANGLRRPGEVGKGVAAGAQQLARLSVHAFALFFGTLGRSVARALHYLSLEDDYLWDVYAYALRHAETLRTLRSSRWPNLLALHLGVQGGLGELGAEVREAVTGVVRKPARGIAAGGLPGLARGALQGVCGLIFRPCAGVALLVSRTSEGVIHAVTSVRDDRPIARIRQPPVVYASPASLTKRTARIGGQAPARAASVPKKLPPWASEELSDALASAYWDLAGASQRRPGPLLHPGEGAWGRRIGNRLYLAADQQVLCCSERHGRLAVVWSLEYARVLEVKAEFESIRFTYIASRQSRARAGQTSSDAKRSSGSRRVQVRRRILWCPTRDLQAALLARFREAVGYPADAASVPATAKPGDRPEGPEGPAAELLALATLRASVRVGEPSHAGACHIAATPR